ncbi:unnamed protein product [Absidia cylindrospora]
MKRSLSTEETEQKKPKQIHPFFDKNNKERKSDSIMRVKWFSGLSTVLIAQSKGIKIWEDPRLIVTKSGRTFAKNSSDWKWWHKGIPGRLAELYTEGYKIVIFSNQNGLNSAQRIAEFKTKVSDIFDEIPVPVLLYAAMKKDRYRKPMTGMWDDMIKEHNDGITVDLKHSFYVGDAAGRPDGWKSQTKKDHSCGDRKFAKNVGITFYTPEGFFSNEKEVGFSWGDFDPFAYSMSLPLFTPTSTPLLPENEDHTEMILFVGRPASGKSSFAKKHVIPSGYTYVNQDTLKTKAKCMKACEESLTSDKSVVIDNTNGTVDARADFIKIAQKHDIPVRCFYFVADEHLCRHNNYYRHITQGDRDLLSEIVFRTFKSRFQEPTLEEGFTEIKKINFTFDGSEDDLSEWRKWYL